MRLSAHVPAHVAAMVLVASSAAVDCGDTITADTVLTQDVGPCDAATDPALVVVGAIVDLNGHRLHCDEASPPARGVLLDGTGAKLSNGAIKSCGTEGAIVLGGGGRHVIDKVVAVDAPGRGFRVLAGSDHAKISNSSAIRASLGFVIEADSARLTHSLASDCEGNGFHSSLGTSNHVIHACTSTGSRIASGFFLGGTGHVLKNSVAARNWAAGILSSEDSEATVRKSQSVGNFGTGIVMPGRGEVTRGTFLNNGNRPDGFLPDIREYNGCSDVAYSKNVFGTAHSRFGPEPCVE